MDWNRVSFMLSDLLLKWVTPLTSDFLNYSLRLLLFLLLAEHDLFYWSFAFYILVNIFSMYGGQAKYFNVLGFI